MQRGRTRTDVRRTVPASGGLQLLVSVLLPLNLELLLRVLPQAALAERREELYGFLSLLSLLLVLLTRWWPLLRPYRRALGLAAFVYGTYHGWLAVQHVLQGDPTNLLFLNQGTQASYWAGIVALLGLLPLAVTSFTPVQRRMGRWWKRLHRLGPWLTLLSALHTAWAGVHFGLMPLKWTSLALVILSLALFFFRARGRGPRRPFRSTQGV
jgi:sulfoxide reductase heme-binding subunit YedZ